MNYNLQPRGIETYAYKYLEQYEDEERQKRSEYHNIDPEMPYGCCSEIDEPFLIRFKDGDVFEIITPQEPEFRMSMNCIPWNIKAGTNNPNADANVIYASCIGKTIINVEVRTFFADKDSMFHDFLDEEHRKRELVSEIILWLDDGNGISISGDFDYCDIAYINKKGILNKIPFGELKKGLSLEKIASIMSKIHISHLDLTIGKLLFISPTKRTSFCLIGLSLVSKENPLMNMEVINFLFSNGKRLSKSLKEL